MRFVFIVIGGVLVAVAVAVTGFVAVMGERGRVWRVFRL
jgi:hypothetical protein